MQTIYLQATITESTWLMKWLQSQPLDIESKWKKFPLDMFRFIPNIVRAFALHNQNEF